MSDIKLIAAIDDKRGIAIGQKLPWDIVADKNYFREKVKDGPVVMGWNTFLANGLKPFGHGKNYVITRGEVGAIKGVEIVHDVQDFLKNLDKDTWVIGGGQIFKEAMPYATHLYITKVEGDYGANIFFPEFEQYFRRIDNNQPQTENGITFSFQLWQRI